MADSQCPALGLSIYQVEATPEGANESVNTNTSSPSSVVDIYGLDVCQYNYSFVGSVFTTDGVQSELSSPVSFSIDLSGELTSLNK